MSKADFLGCEDRGVRAGPGALPGFCPGFLSPPAQGPGLWLGVTPMLGNAHEALQAAWSPHVGEWHLRGGGNTFWPSTPF